MLVKFGVTPYTMDIKMYPACIIYKSFIDDHDPFMAMRSICQDLETVDLGKP